MTFMNALKNSLLELIDYKNWLSNPVYVVCIYSIIAIVIGAVDVGGLVFVLYFYILAVIIYNDGIEITITVDNEDEPKKDETNEDKPKKDETLELKFVRKDYSISTIEIPKPENTEEVKIQYVFELLFQSRDSIFVKAFDAKSALEYLDLTPEQTADLDAIEQYRSV